MTTKKLIAAALFIFLSVSCSQNEGNKQDESVWVEKEYQIEDVIFEFQEMISPEMFKNEESADKLIWSCHNMKWSDYKLRTPGDIYSKTKFSKCHNEPGPIPPSWYFLYLVVTADSEGKFCKKDWESLLWKEKISTNYSDASCAKLMLEFVEEALIEKRMTDSWKKNKKHWIKAVKKIADRPE